MILQYSSAIFTYSWISSYFGVIPILDTYDQYQILFTLDEHPAILVWTIGYSRALIHPRRCSSGSLRAFLELALRQVHHAQDQWLSKRSTIRARRLVRCYGKLNQRGSQSLPAQWAFLGLKIKRLTWNIMNHDFDHPNKAVPSISLPSGNLLRSYWKWPFIVDFPIKNGDFQ